jgi:Peptidase family C25
LPDKAIISNQSAIVAKYGAAGVASVKAALQTLIQADSTRGLTTQCYWVDDPAQMRQVRGACPRDAKDQQGNKLAVDAIAEATSPDYLVLLDGPDVIPHIVLNNPLPYDGEATVDSDLPYASAAAFSPLAASYLQVTRVVGRIPNVPGANTPDRLINCLNVAANSVSKPPTNYAQYFGLCAQVWQTSTELSLDAVFGNHAQLDVAPPAGPPATGPHLANLSHFINCHGASASPEFYGQSGNNYPVSLDSKQVSTSAPPDVVVAAECCYGAQLYDPAAAGGVDPICMAYLGRGALGYLGSTTIAYGPSTSNGQADLLTQYFLEETNAGASTGRALLEARIKFIAGQMMSNPANLKTLAQFLLLGDPSVTPCTMPAPQSPTKGLDIAEIAEDASAQRKARRIRLASIGLAITDAKAVPAGPGSASETVKNRVRTIAAGRNFGKPRESVFAVSGGPNFISMAKARDVSETVMVITTKEDSPPHIQLYRHIIAHLIGDGIAALEEIMSR